MATPTTLPASFNAGAILTATQMNDLRGAFRVLQVVSAKTIMGSGTTVSTSTFTATGLTATITPKFATSKILVLVSQGNRKTNANASTEVGSNIFRNGAVISTQHEMYTCVTGSATELRIMASLSLLDSPATTSATTYTMYGMATVGTASFDYFCSGSITLMEISA